MKQLAYVIAIAISLFPLSAAATEGGGSVYPVGAENFSCCALPPPGLYGAVYYQHYAATQVRDNDGAVVSPGTFQVTANAIVPRFIWITPVQLAGASLGLHSLLPVVNLDVNVNPEVHQRKLGAADLILGPVLGWHLTEALHGIAAIDAYLPIGSYEEGDVANVGRNHFALQPVLGLSYVAAEGINADLKAMWTYNFANPATDYHDGQELIIDYAVGYGVGHGFTLGFGGYYYNQLTDDAQADERLADSRGHALALGPSLRYDSGAGWFLAIKYQDEMLVRNRPDGSALWSKVVFAL